MPYTVQEKGKAEMNLGFLRFKIIRPQFFFFLKNILLGRQNQILCQSAWAAITIPQTGQLNQQKYIFSQFWRLEIWGPVGLISDEDSLGCRWPPFCCVLTCLSSVYGEKVRSLVSLSLPTRIPVLLDSGSTFMTLPNLNYLPKGPISKCSHIGGQGFNM